MKSLDEKKSEAIKEYKEAKQAYIENQSNENWIRFCNAKRNCMMIGCRI